MARRLVAGHTELPRTIAIYLHEAYTALGLALGSRLWKPGDPRRDELVRLHRELGEVRTSAGSAKR